MKALIVGGGGQLGRSLAVTAPKDVEVVIRDRSTLDITDPSAVGAIIEAVRPDLLLNAAAYTAVDKAESEEDAARAVNATAVGVLADAARKVGARFGHVSTDFVFDGRAGVPYRPDSPTAPLGAYGRSKLAGERAAGSEALIVRTAWVYAATGNNFVRTMLRLMASHPQVRVVADQIGTPTYAPGLAGAFWALAEQDARGIYHYTDSGAASWYDFAVAIQEEALAIGLLGSAVPILPITTADYPTPAVRPYYSVLEKSKTWSALGAPAPHWRVNLRVMLSEIRTNG